MTARTLLRSVPLPLVLVAMIALSGVVLGRVYAGGLLSMLVLGAGVGSVLVSVAARRLRSWLVAPLSVLALLGYAAVAVRLAARHAELPGGLGAITLDAATNGIPRLLTAMIPVTPAPDTVLVPLVAAWLAGLTGAEVGLRAGRVLLGYLPPALLYAGAVYVVGPNAEPAFGPTLAFALLAMVGLAVSARPAVGSPGVPATARTRLAATTAAGLAAVVGLVAVLAPLVSAQVDERPVDPRRYVEPPRVETFDENPLIRISGWALNPDQPLLEVDAAAPADGGNGDGELRLRLGVLSDYDGVTWTVGATYRNAGRFLPATQPAPGSRVEEVRQVITVAGLRGRLLPAVATPQRVEGARVAYDPATGTLIRPEGLTPGLRYAVTSVRERPDVNLLATADVPAGGHVARVLRVPDGVPEPMRRLAAQLAQDNGAPYARAAAIEQFLAEHYRLTPDAPSGHAYPNLAFFLFGTRESGGQRGTSEQFAAAFAVLGRLAGLPTRVVVGFAAPARGPVRAADAFAWPEVLFDGLGWVAFDPLPRPEDEPRPVEEDFRPTPQDPPSAAPEPIVEPTAPAPPQAVAPPPEHGGGATTVLVAGGFVAVLGLAGVVLLLLRRRTTRHRLERGAPARRVAGAWREVTDALRLAGQPAGRDLAATEVAAFAQTVLTSAAASARRGTPGQRADVAVLADLLNQAAFAPDLVTEEQARQAVRVAGDFVGALRAARPGWRRLVWSVHPGPLRHARRASGEQAVHETP